MAEYDVCTLSCVTTAHILLGSIFYFGYLIAQWPAGLAFQKLPVGKFLGGTTISKSSSWF